MEWTNDEMKIIRENYVTMTDTELQKLLPNRTKASIAAKRVYMGLSRGQYKKYSFDDVVKEFSKNNDYILLSTKEEFKDCNSKMRYICSKHRDKGEQAITLNHLQSGRSCAYCSRENAALKRTIQFNKDFDKRLCELNNFKYLDTIRENGKITISFICNAHKELGVQHMAKKNMERDIKGCKYCSGKQLPEWYVLQQIEKINPNIQLLEPYKNLTTSMNCLCIKHNYNTKKTIQEILKGQGCYYCGIEKLSKGSYLTLSEFQKQVEKKNSNIIALEYYGKNQNALFQCKLCGAQWYSSSTGIKQCPNCAKFYTGEKLISLFLTKWGITYKTQFRFDQCRDKRTLPFDFYLPNYNVCIEFDGMQHFEQRKGWSKLDLIQKHDNIKNLFCHENKIPLIRIPYWEQDDIDYYLFDCLVKCNVLEEIKNMA